MKPKLVRDKIPQIIIQKGGAPTTRIADKKEYEESLFEKLREELIEFQEAKNKGEYADIIEVLRAIAAFYKWKKKDLETIRKEKYIKRGGFKKRIILEKY